MRHFLNSVVWIFDQILWFYGVIFWHFSRFATKLDFVWLIYLKTAGPTGWLWGRFLGSTVWMVRFSWFMFACTGLLFAAMSEIAPWIQIVMFVCIMLLYVAYGWLTKKLIMRNKHRILQFIENLENARQK